MFLSELPRRRPLNKISRALTVAGEALHTRDEMQLSFKSAAESEAVSTPSPATLAHLRRGERAVIERLEVPEDVARRLMELGFLPGSTVTAGLSAPGGDPCVFQVDGSEIALRRETAAHLKLRRVNASRRLTA